MKKFLLLLFICSIGFAQQSEIYQRAKISLDESHTLADLSNLGLAVDHGIFKKDISIISEFSVSEIAKAKNAGFTVEILVEDAKAEFLKQNANPNPVERNADCDNGIIDYVTPNNFTLGSMGGYLTYQELLDQLDLMKSLYPNLITSKENISTFLTEGTPDNSVTPSIGGNGIKWVKISDNPDSTTEGEPQILYTAIHHAREPISLSQLVFYMWYLLENYETDPQIKGIVDNTELYFVPVINPDGYLYNQKTDPNGGGFWRKNRKNTYGTDLNRNYNYFINGNPNNGSWGGEGTSSNFNSDVYHGPSPFSEVETQAMKFFVENHNFVMAFNNHTYSNLLLYPYGFTQNYPTPENDLFQGISEELVSQNGFANIISSELYSAAGGSDDFMYGTVGTHSKIYSFTPEIGDSFWPSISRIIPLCKGMMYNNITGAQMVKNYAVLQDNSSYYIGDGLNKTQEFDLKRLGITGTGNFTVSLIPISDNIVSAGPSVTINGLDLLASQTGSISYVVDGITGAFRDQTVVFNLVVNNGDYDTSYLFFKETGTPNPVLIDPGNSATDNFNNNGWGTTTSTFVSPSSSITDSPNGNYQSNANKTIALNNPISLQNSSGASVTFYAKWDLENDYDYVQFEISIDNGASWIPQCGKFTNAGSDNGAQPIGEPIYDGTVNDWVLEEISLEEYINENILARFHLVSDNGINGDGFYFDDLTFNVVEDILSTEDYTTSQFTIYPNPVSNILIIKTQLTNYTAEVYTIQGQLVEVSENNNGTTRIDYSKYSSGLYILELNSEKKSQTLKIIKE